MVSATLLPSELKTTTPAMSLDKYALTGSTDVVVIGSGVAGLSAAIEVAATGAHVIVLEALSTIGGASILSGGGCCMIKTPLQRQQGIIDDIELALADWAAMGGPTADLEWARQYLENSRVEVFDWCKSLGISWTALLQPEGNTVPRWHQPQGWGREVVRILEAHAASLGVEVLRDSPVKELLLTDQGSIRGVRVGGKDGEETQAILSHAVIVCAGGFTGDLTKIYDASPQLRELPRLLSGGSPTAKGLGHELLGKLGADMVNMDHVWVYPTGTPDPTDTTGQRGLGVRALQGDVWLNQDGHRFHNEMQKGGHSGTNALLSQPGRTAWAVFNATEVEHLELLNNGNFFPPPVSGALPPGMKAFWQTSRYAWRCDNAKALAKAIGLPPDAVLAAINDFNSAIAGGLKQDPQFGRSLVGAAPIEQDIVALQLFPMAQKNFGGVRTDRNCRVLHAGSGEPIVGLFAAGEVAGMAGGRINGRAAIEGTMFGPCLYSGRMAGRAAVGDVARGSRQKL